MWKKGVLMCSDTQNKDELLFLCFVYVSAMFVLNCPWTSRGVIVGLFLSKDRIGIFTKKTEAEYSISEQSLHLIDIY